MRSEQFESLTVHDIGNVDRMALNAARMVLSIAAFDRVCKELDEASNGGFDSACLLAEVARIIHREYV